MAKEYLNECRIVEIHEHTLDTDVLVQLYDFPVFKLNDIHHSPHEAHDEKGIEHYSKHDRVLAKFISHDEVQRTKDIIGNVAFGIGIPNIEATNCRGEVVEVVTDGEHGGNTIIINLGTLGKPIYVHAIDRNKRKLTVGEYALFHKIHQLVVKHVISPQRVRETTPGDLHYQFTFRCSNCNVTGHTIRSASDNMIDHKTYFDKKTKAFTETLTENGVPLYAGNRVCPACQSAGLEWKKEEVQWRSHL